MENILGLPPEIPQSPGQITYPELLSFIIDAFPEGFSQADVMAPQTATYQGKEFHLIFLRQGALQEPIVLTKDDFDLSPPLLKNEIQSQVLQIFQKFAKERSQSALSAIQRKLK